MENIRKRKRRIKINTNQDRAHITYEIVSLLKKLDLAINMMEVYTYVIYLKLPEMTDDEFEELLNKIYEIDVVETVEEIDLIAFEERDIEMNQILDIIPQGVMVVGLNKDIRYINNYFAERILKTPSEEITNKKLSQIIKDEGFLNILDSNNKKTDIIRNKDISIGKENYILDLSPILSDNSNLIGHIISINEAGKRYVFDNMITFDDIIGESEKMKEVIGLGKDYANSDTPLMIKGEAGTGKELLARSIHSYSDRRDKPFININCRTLPESQLERELFGYTRDNENSGEINKSAFELAEGGSLFIDGIDEMATNIQMRFLSVLKEGRLESTGSMLSRPLNVRIITSSSKDKNLLEEYKKLNPDLLFEVNALRIDVPSLRARQEDIRILAESFVDQYKKKYNKPRIKLSTKALIKLEDYLWPGNIRELQNVIERAVLKSNNTIIKESDIDLDNVQYMKQGNVSLKKLLAEIERDIVVEALNNNKSIRAAARKLEVTHTLLINRIKKYKILDEEWK